MLGFHPLATIRQALNHFDSLSNKYEIASKTFVDARYPGNDPSILNEWASMHGWNYVRPSQNRGVAENWSWVMRELDLKEGDVLFGMDPDGRPQQNGYLDAIMDVFNACPEVYTVQLNRPCVYAQNRPRFERQVGNGTWIIDYHQLVAWSLGAFDCGWLRKIGGLKQRHPIYGYTEHATDDALGPLGGKWVITKDFYDVHLKSTDHNYTDWKMECAHNRTRLPFEQWLESRA